MITVVGEALIDLVISPDGAVDATLGGAPYNTARACGRLGVDTRFVGALSVDRFGEQLVEQLLADRVDVSAAPRVEQPTTLAAAALDDSGVATYRFYIDGTSAPQLTAVPAGRPGDVLFTGGLGLLLEPMATTVEAALAEPVADRIVVVDLNCRPLIIPDREAYVGRVERVVASGDVVKVSDEDLAYLAPDEQPVEAARRLLDRGPVAVLMTSGGEGVHVITVDGHQQVPVEPV
ncbi:MAG: carbohydrate kinase, partial [Ilumatobacter sp.]|nr:carbohydrate kinase [Ilumatobacter sp.]